jgi:import receptor subunit TOM20
MSQSVRIATAVAATATVLAGSYALYFDYQRRHNPDFRRQIRMSLGSNPNFKEETDQQDCKRRKLRLRKRVKRRL